MSPSVSARDADATLGKFHGFGALPCEIRHMIWKFAARDVKRGVHVLGAIRNGQATNPNGAVGLTLVAPTVQDIPGSTRLWVDGNPSTYIQDSGLWMACPESRDIMGRLYKRLEDAITEDEASHRSHFVHLGEERYLKAFPAQDLLCLHPLETSLPFCALPFFELPDRLRNGNLNNFKNIALEYDPAWMNGSVSATTDKARERAREEMWREDSLRGVFIRALWAIAKRNGPADLTFWLIDRTVRRREEPSNVYMPFGDDDDDNDGTETDEKTGPTVFHGRDGQYVEVHDLGECKYDVVKSNTAFHFLHWLQIDVGFNVRWMVSRRRSQNPLPLPQGLGDLVKILCVEPT
ncbi:hypothetical protein LI328DRAFT_163926 [Trichoderma asperelloides]|nr:hypothetical protein LI328DRAFT_163926 [Trichoderma asperelloides]